MWFGHSEFKPHLVAKCYFTLSSLYNYNFKYNTRDGSLEIQLVYFWFSLVITNVRFERITTWDFCTSCMHFSALILSSLSNWSLTGQLSFRLCSQHRWLHMEKSLHNFSKYFSSYKNNHIHRDRKRDRREKVRRGRQNCISWVG